MLFIIVSELQSYVVCRCNGSREKLEKYKTKLLQLLALSYTPPAPPPPPPPPPTDSLEVNIVHY